MKRLIYIAFLFIGISVFGQTPPGPVTVVKNIKITDPVEGTMNDSVIVWRGSGDKITRFLKISDIVAAAASGGVVPTLQQVLTSGSTAEISTPVSVSTSETIGFVSQDNTFLLNPDSASIDSNLQIGASENPQDAVQRQEVQALISQSNSYIPENFYMNCPSRGTSGFLAYFTDQLRFYSLSAQVSGFTYGREIFRQPNTNNIIAYSGSSSTGSTPMKFVVMRDCKVINNEFVPTTITSADISITQLSHGTDIDDQFVYVSTRVETANVDTTPTEIIKINIDNLNDIKRLNLPLPEYAGRVGELKEYKQYLYVVVTHPTTFVSKLVRISKNLDFYETLVTFGGSVNNQQRFAMPFTIYNDEIIIPSNDYTNSTTQKTNLVISVYSLDGTLKRQRNITMPVTTAHTTVIPHWMTIYNNKAIISPTGGSPTAELTRYIMRFDIGYGTDNNTIVYEDALPVVHLISDDNSLGTDGYLTFSPELSSGTYPNAELFRVFYSNFSDKTVIATNYSSIGSINPKVALPVSQGSVTKVSGTANQITSTGGTTPVLAIDNNYTTQRDEYANSKVSDAINDGVTTIAPSQNAVFDALATKQNTLVSGTNIKTVNGNSLLGSGDISISGGATNLTYTASPTNGIVVSDTGTDATIPLGDNTNAGLVSPGSNAKLANVPSNTNTAISAKQDVISGTGYPYFTGTSISWLTGNANEYVRPDGTKGNFGASVRNNTALTGLSTGTNTAITASDTVLSAFQNLQAQISAMPGFSVSAATTTQTASTLNSSYPGVIVGYRVFAPSVGSGMMYVKTTTGGQWIGFAGATLNP